MTDQQNGGQPKAAQQPKAAAYKRGQLVQFTARDAVTGGQLAGIGVVTLGSDGGGNLSVRPLADHDVSVDPAEAEPVVVDEV